jgi:hypothetical protein
MPASLVGVRAKIARAEQHLQDFETAWRTHSAISTHVVLESIEELPEGRRATVSITSGQLALDLGVPLGDAVHNLRSSLDHLVCQLAVAAGNPAACDKTQFPIFATDTPDNRRRIQRWIRHTTTAAQAEIVAFQPFNRQPNDPSSDLLWLLSELDNIDKHRLLLVARAHFRDMLFSFAIDGEWREITLSCRPEWQPLRFGTDPLRFRLTIPRDPTKPETNVEVKAEPVVGAVFQQTGLKCDGHEIIPTLSAMASEVKALVDSFQSKGLI